MTFTTQYFTLPGGPALHVARHGNGVQMLFQHGLCGAAAQPHEVFPFDVPAQCHTIECRGHGQSQAGRAADFSIAQFADDCASYISATFLEPIVVGGISMGAAIALRLAVKRPDLVRGLVLARPAWVVDHAPDNMKPNLEVGKLLAEHDIENAEALFRSSETFDRLHQEAPDNLASLLTFFRRVPQDITAQLLQRISLDGPGVSLAAVRALSIPTLIIGHGHDAIHPVAHAQALAALVPHSQLIEITPKAVDKAKYVSDFQSALRNFLKGLSS
jgi:pimeloyl-ACP methyl ester carboxylesterase